MRSLCPGKEGVALYTGGTFFPLTDAAEPSKVNVNRKERGGGGGGFNFGSIGRMKE